MYYQKSVSFKDLPQISHTDKAYQLGDALLRPFYEYAPKIDSFVDVLRNRTKSLVNRQLLVDVLEAQYNTIDTSDAVRANIASLADNKTFTIVTAHQPSLITGPLYFIYKICSVIKLSKQVQERNPDYKIVPTFVMGGEDHDFDEISSLHFNKLSISWHTAQKGSVGRMTLDGISDVLNEIKSLIGYSPNAIELVQILEGAHHSSKTYGEFMMKIIDTLFNRFGLIIANLDNPSLKQPFVELVIRDLEESISTREVMGTQRQLNAQGFKSQAYVRELNIFFMTDDRHRIIENQDGSYTINNEVYDRQALIQLLRQNPGAISPNVVLRPIYQEFTLPNLAYVGGGGELAYWLERKSQFEAFNIPYPMLVRRDSLLLLEYKDHATLSSINFDLALLFQREDTIINHLAKAELTNHISLQHTRQSIKDIYEKLRLEVETIDKTIGATVIGALTKSEKGLDYIENKIIKATKNKHEVTLSRISRIKSKYFPGNNSLQERRESFLPYYTKYGKEWIDKLIDHCDPFNTDFKILLEQQA